jgi:general secretion pathway protein A
MYEEFFGFNRRPFDLTPNPKFLVLTDSHREALSNLEYGIASKKGITLLLGEAGSGKTTIIRAALERQPQRVHCVHLHNPTLTREEFVQCWRRASSCRKRRSIRRRAAARARGAAEKPAGPRRVDRARIDEAQSLPPDLLEEIRCSPTSRPTTTSWCR